MTSLVSRRLLWLTCLACLILTTSIQAGGPPTPKKPAAPKNAAAIRQFLNSKQTLVNSGNSLDDILTFLKNQTGIPFELDRTTGIGMGMNMGFAPPGIIQQPGTFHLKIEKAPAGVGLKQFFARYGLSYCILGNRVYVTNTHRALTLQMRQSVNVHFQQTTAKTALKTLEDATGTTIWVDPTIQLNNKTKFDLQLGAMPLEDAVRLVGFAGGLKSVRVGNVFVLTSVEKAKLLPKEQPLNQNTFNQVNDIIGGPVGMNFGVVGPAVGNAAGGAPPVPLPDIDPAVPQAEPEPPAAGPNVPPNQAPPQPPVESDPPIGIPNFQQPPPPPVPQTTLPGTAAPDGRQR